MLVSWNWLKEYVPLEMSPEQAALRLAMSGLNHEGTCSVGQDLAIDLEVTSNRPDCLGHLGVAREVSVLFDLPLKKPAARPVESASDSVGQLAQVRIDCPRLCPRYTARVIQGVQIGPSPEWLRQRLATIGVASINNVVDATNFVMMECGQPLHAFDLAYLRGFEIIVREARSSEPFLAIDHRAYTLQPGMCVIADAKRSVALGGVMGGVDSEVSAETRDVLIESAAFQPLAIRTTARQLKLHSPSSYRFERGVDWEGIDWASRRCCELILELAGGQLAAGVIDVISQDEPPSQSIVLRLPQIERILGIRIAAEEVVRILTAIGNELVEQTSESVKVRPPSWRRDLTREIDLIEEVGRIHGYDAIPEDVGVPMTPSYRHDAERVHQRVRRVLTAAGFDEAVTASVVTEDASALTSPWTEMEAIRSRTPMLEGADRLRRSLLPSLLGARKRNESLANPVIELFEIARVYLPRPDELPAEPQMVALTSGRDFLTVKGVLQSLVQSLHPEAVLETQDCDLPLLDPNQRCQVICEGQRLGYLGRLHPQIQQSKRWALRGPTVLAELKLGVLEQIAQLVPQSVPQSAYPAITRDLNFVLDESIPWADLADTVSEVAGDMLEQLDFREIYRDPQKDGAGKKRLLFSFQLRSPERTLTGEEAEAITAAVVTACETKHHARLLA